MIRLFFCLLEAALKMHLAQISEGALRLNGHDASEHDNASVYKARFKKKMIYSISVEELDWSA